MPLDLARDGVVKGSKLVQEGCMLLKAPKTKMVWWARLPSRLQVRLALAAAKAPKTKKDYEASHQELAQRFLVRTPGPG